MSFEPLTRLTLDAHPDKEQILQLIKDMRDMPAKFAELDMPEEFDDEDEWNFLRELEREVESEIVHLTDLVDCEELPSMNDLRDYRDALKAMCVDIRLRMRKLG